MYAVGMWYAADSFYYIYKTATGDGSVEMFVENLNGQYWARFGLMIRSSLDPDSKYFAFFRNGNDVVQGIHLRPNDGDETWTDTNSYSSLPIPLVNAWIKITKSGNTFQTFYKTGTDDWSSALGTYTLELSDPYYYGIFLSSNTATATGRGTLPVFSELLPDGWNEADIGPDYNGDSVVSSSYTLSGDTIEMTASTGGECLTM